MSVRYNDNTKTRRLWEVQQLAMAEARAVYDEIIQEEFPPGTRVRWVHTFKGPQRNEPQYRCGEVANAAHGCLYVRMKPGGPTHSIPAKWAAIEEAAP